jgi:hypothetical protein
MLELPTSRRKRGIRLKFTLDLNTVASKRVIELSEKIEAPRVRVIQQLVGIALTWIDLEEEEMLERMKEAIRG